MRQGESQAKSVVYRPHPASPVYPGASLQALRCPSRSLTLYKLLCVSSKKDETLISQPRAQESLWKEGLCR